MVKNPSAMQVDVRDTVYQNCGFIFPGLGRSPGEGHKNPLQYLCLENPIDRGAWQAAVHRVTQSQTLLKCLSIAHTVDRKEQLHDIEPRLKIQ